jgi:hypothetical protein
MVAFTDAYLESCRAARLRRWPERAGREALRLERGDLYAWREGVAPSSGAIGLSLIAEPRTVFIVDDRIWWVPRLEQLLQRLEATILRRDSVAGVAAARESIALQLAGRVRERDWSWEEAALALLLDWR